MARSKIFFIPDRSLLAKCSPLTAGGRRKVSVFLIRPAYGPLYNYTVYLQMSKKTT